MSTYRLLKDHSDILVAFNKHGVRYLVIGGHAVSAHAEPRGTKDLALFIKADEENSKAVFRALAEFGAPIAGLTPADFNDKPTTIFQMGIPPARIDILQGIEGVNFDEAWQNRLDGLLANEIPTHVISRDDLIRNKLAVGRLRDLADVESLREAVEAESSEE